LYVYALKILIEMKVCGFIKADYLHVLFSSCACKGKTGRIFMIIDNNVLLATEMEPVTIRISDRPVVLSDSLFRKTSTDLCGITLEN
jgi:hypothetical protein